MDKSYYLSRHAFFCLAGNRYVFLDLRNDEYSCLGRTHTDTLKRLINGRHLSGESADSIRLQDDRNSNASAVVLALLQKELLVQEVSGGKPTTPPSIVAPATGLAEGFDRPIPEMRTEHVWKFFAASATASNDLRRRSIERVVRNVEARKLAHLADSVAMDHDLITDLFDIFRKLRPYYPRPYLCLFDSLALVHFFARFAVFPQWVYGVKLEPFAAHCWVQVEDQVVNDIVDNVRDYTPIMTV